MKILIISEPKTQEMPAMTRFINKELKEHIEYIEKNKEIFPHITVKTCEEENSTPDFDEPFYIERLKALETELGNLKKISVTL